MFIPYHIENWVIVMDVKYMGAMSLPIKTIRRITDVTTVNFCSTMDQMLILNPSFIVKATWNIVKCTFSLINSYRNTARCIFEEDMLH
jgi:hypothetical protein